MIVKDFAEQLLHRALTFNLLINKLEKLGDIRTVFGIQISNT